MLSAVISFFFFLRRFTASRLNGSLDGPFVCVIHFFSNISDLPEKLINHTALAIDALQVYGRGEARC